MAEELTQRNIGNLLFSELGFPWMLGIGNLLGRAWQVHQARGTGEEAVSRSTLLYAALYEEPLVQAVLEANGLRVETLQRRLGVGALPDPDIRGDIDFPILEETAGRAFRAYRKLGHNRPLDSLGFAAAVLQKPNGMVEQHLLASGLDIRAAAARLAAFVDASKDYPWINVSAPLFAFDPTVQAIVDEARRVKDPSTIIITNYVFELLAVRRGASGSEPALAFLWQYFHEIDEKLLVERLLLLEKTPPDFEATQYTQILAATFEDAAYMARDGIITPRHLVGALIGARSLDFNSLLRDFAVDRDALKYAYMRWLEQNAPPDAGDELAAWRRLFRLGDKSFLARFNAEQSGGADWLQIQDHVDAFATMIASDRIAPPLAIGLFGDWGSGKSFFMAKLREAVTERAARAQNRKESPYYSRIVQIEFNAWHYVESNLWASLVENVFSNLKLTTGEHEDSVAARRAELAKQIDALIADRAAAEEKLQKAEVARTQATNELEAKTKLAEASAAGLRGLQAVNVWELVQIDPKELNDELGALGVQAVLTSKDDVRKTLDELRAAGKRAEVIRSWITRRPLALTLLAILIILTPFAVGAVGEWLRVNTTIAQLLAPLGTALAWLAARMKKANGIFDRIDAARTKIDNELKTVEDTRQAEIKAADDRLKAAVDEVSAAKTALEKHEQAVATAKENLIDLSRGRRLARFINERAASDDYRKLLGVLATVRHDFSTLSRLMYPEEGDPRTLGDEFHLDRIILYIDDLDRCQPDRVVEVLQAVHLLLAFKLFVVVVGVDARWVSESLRQKHRALREKSGADLNAGDTELMGYAAKPHDYLEKIFQVPFWLEPLSPGTTANYIGHLLADDVVRPSVEPSSGAAGTPRIAVSATPSGAADPPSGAVPQPPPARDRKQPKQPVNVDPRVLTIDPRELEFMRAAPITALVSRSPRTTKRFVNTYRFMRAGVPSHELEDYLDDKAGLPRYKAVLILLSIVVGAPDVSLEVFESIKLPENAELSMKDLAARLDSEFAAHPDLDEWQRVSQSLKALSAGEKVADLTPHVDAMARYSFRPPYAHLALRKARPRDPFPIRIVERPANASPS